MGRITVSELNKISFYQVPKAFHHNPKYITMNSDSKLAYALLRDLLDLSIKNGWVNANGEIYVKLSRKKLMLRLNIKGTQKITKVMQELKDVGLIEEEQVGLNKCNEIYICTPENLTELYDDSDLLELSDLEKNNSKTIENKGDLKIKTPEKPSEINGDLKIKTPEIRKSKVKSCENQKHNNTNITKTKFSSSSNQKREEKLKEHFEENICKLRKTTTYKFLKWIEKETDDFIIALIDYEAGIPVSSWNGFEKAINNFKKQNIHTVAQMELAIDKFREERNKKNTKNNKTNIKNNKNKNKSLRFCDFPQREYDYDALENKLLGWENDDEQSENDDLQGTDYSPAMDELKKITR